MAEGVAAVKSLRKGLALDVIFAVLDGGYCTGVSREGRASYERAKQ